MEDIIINADDAGISPGCNAAIADGCAKGRLNSVSFFANGDYLEDAIKKISRLPGVSCGVHLTLCYGKALSGASALAPDGFLRNSYLSLLLRSIFSKRSLADIELEFECQIRHLLAFGLNISHIDSHRHVHMIPPIFKIVAKLAEKYGIKRIRHSNESLFFSLSCRKWPWRLTSQGVVKYLLMKLFALLIEKRGDERRFVSMVYSGAIDAEFLGNVVNSGKRVEIMLHPGFPKMDEDVPFHNEVERSYWLSENRLVEAEACLSA